MAVSYDDKRRTPHESPKEGASKYPFPAQTRGKVASYLGVVLALLEVLVELWV